MTSAIGWYGPLIDLSKAESHLGSFVQLLVFVHRISPIQYKLANGGGAVIRTDIQVADNTRPYFSVTLWNKQMNSLFVAGDLILLQNVKIIKFRDAIEAKTVQCSSLLRLIHESLISKSAADLVAGCQVGVATKEKLHKAAQQKEQALKNWKAPDAKKTLEDVSLLEVFGLTKSCMAIFSASIGEIFLPITWRALDESEKENMFISRRLLTTTGNDKLVEDLTCIGCSLCGSPLSVDHSRPMSEQKSVPLNCQRSSNCLHVVSVIYRPFMLYVWDKSTYMPISVRNKAAEILFGNIKAENVYRYHEGKSNDQNPCARDDQKTSSHNAKPSNDLRKLNLYLIWLILLRSLLLGKNSPLKFKVAVNADLEKDNEKIEMISMSAPYFVT
ncbi:hypothetical protein ACFE04_025566 [Oxalis oulophora]